MVNPLNNLLRNWLGHPAWFPPVKQCLRNVGVLHYLKALRALQKTNTLPAGTLVRVGSKYVGHPLHCRAGSSDYRVYKQIFLDREYACLDFLGHARLIIDCGANVGFSSAYFLSRFPGARLIAVEPDPGNFALLQKNLAPYGARATCIQKAVWSHATRLAFNATGYRDNEAWSRQVRECSNDEPGGLAATDIPTLLAESGQPRISVLKMDIEGAEGVVFSRNVDAWLDRVDTMVIEIHDDTVFGNCSEAIGRATARKNFSVSRCGELHVFKRAGQP